MRGTPGGDDCKQQQKATSFHSLKASPARPHSDTAILCDVLDRGPATLRQLAANTGLCKAAAVRAANRLVRVGLLQFNGYAPDHPGRIGPLPRLIDVGPRIKR